MIKRKLQDLTIKQKLRFVTYGIFLLLSMLIAYLIFSIVSFGDSYNQIVKNITAANAYNLDFKENVDYGVYRMIAGKVQAKDIAEKLELESPYDIIEEARAVFYELEEITKGEGNIGRLSRIQKGFNTLEKRIDEIDETVVLSGYYDANIENLDRNVRMLTELIQNQIQEYIYYETAQIEAVRLEIDENRYQAIYISIGLLIVAALITNLTNGAISRSIAVPISNLCNMTEKVAKGDFETQLEEGPGDEVSILTESFNSMVLQIGTLVDDIKEEQKNLRTAELKLLQAQINPHFLYNTLDTIIWLAEMEMTDKVVHMVTSLSDFFRSTLSGGRDYIMVREEIAQVRSYLEIQQVRYQDIMEYEINVEKSIEEYDVIKILLQPLVENALYHGIKNKRGKGKITVTGRRQGEEIVFIVEDNGIGMTEEKVQQLEMMKQMGGQEDRREDSFGTLNVNERIRLNYGEAYGLHFESTYGYGTKVYVTIPLEKKENNIQV